MKSVTYHYVRPWEQRFAFLRHLNVDDFKAQLDFFESGYDLVDQRAFENALQSNTPPERGILLTFDDGFKDHFLYVASELEQRSAWALFFVPASPYRTGKLLAVHRIHLLLATGSHGSLLARIREIADVEQGLDVSQEDAGQSAYRQTEQTDEVKVKRLLNYQLQPQVRDNILDRLMVTQFGDEAQLCREFYATLDELRDIAARGFSIGAHSVSHRVLAALTPDEQRAEIEGGYDFLREAGLAQSLRTFAYPYGLPDTYDNTTLELLKDAGTHSAFTVEQRDTETDDILEGALEMPRFDCNSFAHGKVRSLPAGLDPS